MTLPSPDSAAPEDAARTVKDFIIDAPVEAVWDALRDFGSLSTRLVAGFVTSCRLERRGRIVGFRMA